MNRLLDCWDWSDSKKPVGTKEEADEGVSPPLPPFIIVSLCVRCGGRKRGMREGTLEEESKQEERFGVAFINQSIIASAVYFHHTRHTHTHTIGKQLVSTVTS